MADAGGVGATGPRRNPSAAVGVAGSLAPSPYLQKGCWVLLLYGCSVVIRGTSWPIATTLTVKCSEAGALINDVHGGSRRLWRSSPEVIEGGMAVSGSLLGYDWSLFRDPHELALGSLGALQISFRGALLQGRAFSRRPATRLHPDWAKPKSPSI